MQKKHSLILAFLFFASFPFQGGCEQAAEESTAQLISAIRDIPLGISEKELLDKYPGLDKLPAHEHGGEKHESYYKPISSGFLGGISFIFGDGKLEMITSSQTGRLNWKTAANIAKNGKAFYNVMLSVFGEPAIQKVMTGRPGFAVAYINWKYKSGSLFVTMDTPKAIMEMAETSRNPRGNIMIIYGVESYYDRIKEIKEDLNRAYFDIDYDKFMNKLDLQEVKNTDKYLPEELKGINIGMDAAGLKKSVNELKEEMSGPEEPYRYNTKIKGLFHDVQFNFRAGKLAQIIAVLKDPKDSKEGLKWCSSKWGEPEELYLRYQNEILTGKLFVWNFDGIKCGAEIRIMNNPEKDEYLMVCSVFENKMDVKYEQEYAPEPVNGSTKGLNAKEEWGKYSGK